MKTLHLNLCGEYFDAIAEGEKTEEFRLCNPYWEKRLVGRDYDQIIIKRGYPKRGDVKNMICRPYRGYTKKEITHEHFGNVAVQVFAINVEAS